MFKKMLHPLSTVTFLHICSGPESNSQLIPQSSMLFKNFIHLYIKLHIYTDILEAAYGSLEVDGIFKSETRPHRLLG